MLSGALAVKRGSLQAAALDGAVYALGGYDSKAGVASVELYDVRADRWRNVAPMTNARCYSAAVVHEGKVRTLCISNISHFTISCLSCDVLAF